MKHLKLLPLLVALSMTGLAFGQYSGPKAKNKATTVKAVKDNAVKLDRQDATLQLRGYITQQISAEEFWFTDTTGKIKVEISKRNQPAKPFDDKTELIITGEVDADLFEGTEIEVKTLTFASTTEN